MCINVHSHASRPSARAVTLCFVVVAIVTTLLLAGPIPQPADYHQFADTRTWLGIPHAANVLSNLPFLLAGGFGIAITTRLPASFTARPAWQGFFVAVLLTAFGSAYYHLAPDNAGLAVDRLPISWACACLTCALLAERVSAAFAMPRTLTIACTLATGAVLAWFVGESAGAGDLRAYLFVQFMPLLLISPVLALYPRGTLRGADWFVAVALYAAAKGFEMFDASMPGLLGATGGHCIKHLLAAGAAVWLAVRLHKRSASGQREHKLLGGDHTAMH